MFTGLMRTIILYILIIAGVRLMGKRQVGELEPSELVLSLLFLCKSNDKSRTDQTAGVILSIHRILLRPHFIAQLV